MAYILPNEKYNGDLRSKKGEALDCDLQFNWLIVKHDGDNICVLAHCEKEPAKALDKDGKTASFPGIVGFTVSTKADAVADKLSAKLLAQCEEGKFYCGRITMGASENIAEKALSNDKKFELYAEDLASFTEIEKPDSVPETLEFPKAWAGGNGRKSYTRAEIAEQRLEALEKVLLNEKLQACIDGMQGILGDEMSEQMKFELIVSLIA
ncbi:hypothetical protein SPB21_27650 [Leptothoe sp. ISB3NOV94-8A]